jgi:hypothetical protein
MVSAMIVASPSSTDIASIMGCETSLSLSEFQAQQIMSWAGDPNNLIPFVISTELHG